MTVNWKNYKKLGAAVIGITVLIALNHYNVAIPGLNSVVLEVIVGALTSFGVYQVTNEKE